MEQGEGGLQAEDEPVGEAVVNKESQSGAGVSILVQRSLAKAWHFLEVLRGEVGEIVDDLRRGHAGGQVVEDVVDAEALAIEAGFPEPHTRVYREAVVGAPGQVEGQLVDVEEPVQVSGLPEKFVVPEEGVFQVGVLEGGMLQVFEYVARSGAGVQGLFEAPDALVRCAGDVQDNLERREELRQRRVGTFFGVVDLEDVGQPCGEFLSDMVVLQGSQQV